MTDLERYRITVKVGRKLWDVELNTLGTRSARAMGAV
jgi:hypothetical protein